MLQGDDLIELYRDLHSHPELSFQETRTAGIVADHLAKQGYEVTDSVGGTGVVGVLRNGDGPRVMLRADMDALPVQEQTGLPYASTATAKDAAGTEVPVMHACGHDVHVACLLAATGQLAAQRESWRGTLVAVFQSAEEMAAGARAMVDDGLAERFGRPDVILGQHVTPIPAGVIGVRSGPFFAGADSLRITLHGRGGHGSRPETCVDPVVLAASVVLRLQTIVSREIPAQETAVVTVGSLHAGTKENVIPDNAELRVSVRTYSEAVRTKVLDAIRRIVEGEAATAGAPTPPEIEVISSFPPLANDAAATERTAAALESAPALVVDPGLVTASEDFGILATGLGAPGVFWLLGGSDPAHFAGISDFEALAAKVAELPSNHSSAYAPVPDPTLRNGAAALVAAARAWLASGDPARDAGIVEDQA